MKIVRFQLVSTDSIFHLPFITTFSYYSRLFLLPAKDKFSNISNDRRFADSESQIFLFMRKDLWRMKEINLIVLHSIPLYRVADCK